MINRIRGSRREPRAKVSIEVIKDPPAEIPVNVTVDNQIHPVLAPPDNKLELIAVVASAISTVIAAAALVVSVQQTSLVADQVTITMRNTASSRATDAINDLCFIGRKILKGQSANINQNITLPDLGETAKRYIRDVEWAFGPRKKEVMQDATSEVDKLVAQATDVSQPMNGDKFFTICAGIRSKMNRRLYDDKDYFPLEEK